MPLNKETETNTDIEIVCICSNEELNERINEHS